MRGDGAGCRGERKRTAAAWPQSPEGRGEEEVHRGEVARRAILEEDLKGRVMGGGGGEDPAKKASPLRYGAPR
jgi:hypothetical protein